MRFEELSPEQIEKTKKRETAEEHMAFAEGSGIELLSDELLEGVAGGKGAGSKKSSKCPKNEAGHKWERTGRTFPGSVFGDWWPDKEIRCIYCGELGIEG